MDVGLLGVLMERDGGTCEAGTYALEREAGIHSKLGTFAVEKFDCRGLRPA